MIKTTLINGTEITIEQGPMLRDDKRLVQISEKNGKCFQILFDRTLPGYVESFSQYIKEKWYTMAFSEAFKKEPEMNKEEWIEKLIKMYPHRSCKFYEIASNGRRYTIVDFTLQVIPVDRVVGFSWRYMHEMFSGKEISKYTVLQRRDLQRKIENRMLIRDDRKSYEVPVKAVIEDYLFD